MTNRLVAVLGGVLLFAVILIGLWFLGGEPSATTQDEAAAVTSEKKKTDTPVKRRPLDIALSTPKPPGMVEKGVVPLNVEEPVEDDAEGSESKPPKVQLGSLSKESISDSFRDVMEDVRGCYQDALKEVPGLSGRITVKLTIVDKDGVGRIQRLSVKEAEFDDVPLEECILDVVDSIEFDPPAGGLVMVQYPFIFNAE